MRSKPSVKISLNMQIKFFFVYISSIILNILSVVKILSMLIFKR